MPHMLHYLSGAELSGKPRNTWDEMSVAQWLKCMTGWVD